MKYINKITGVILETESILLGAWEGYVPSKQTKKMEDKIEKNDPQDKDEQELTIAQIKQELDAFGIEYPKKATKAELLKIVKDMEE